MFSSYTNDLTRLSKPGLCKTSNVVRYVQLWLFTLYCCPLFRLAHHSYYHRSPISYILSNITNTPMPRFLTFSYHLHSHNTISRTTRFPWFPTANWRTVEQTSSVSFAVCSCTRPCVCFSFSRTDRSVFAPPRIILNSDLIGDVENDLLQYLENRKNWLCGNTIFWWPKMTQNDRF